MGFDILIFSIPEGLALTFLAYALSGARASWHKIVLIGVISGLLGAASHLIVSNYLINVLIYSVVLISLNLAFNIPHKWWQAPIAVFLALPIYILLETLSLTIIVSVFQLEPVVIMENLLIKLACFAPQLLLCVLIATLLLRFKISLFSQEEEGIPVA